MTISDEAKVQLRLDFFKTWVTFLLAITGGEIAVLQTLYSTSSHKWILYTSVACLVAACILMLGATECLVNRMYPAPAFKGVLRRSLVVLLPKTLETEWVFSSLGGAFTSLGLGIFAVFIIGG